MNLLGISINHRTAPVDLREALHLSEEEIRNLIQQTKDKVLSEGIVISTCNRTEIYGIPKQEGITHLDLQNLIINFKSAAKISEENFQKFISRDSVEHLFRVATGIDSLLIGDNQIFKQVKDSFIISEEMNFAGFLVKRLMDAAVRVGKRAINETAISEGAVTVSYAAVQLVEKIFANLSKKSALVIGTGETGEIAAKHLRDRGIGRLALTNRTFEKAEKLATELNTAVFPFDTFKDHLHKFDIIISATSSENIILSKEDVEKAMRKRNYESLVIMDIAIPRDVDPGCKDIEYVFYHDIDSLNVIVQQNLAKRRSEIPKVEKIIQEELDAFFDWYNSLQVAPTIKDLRDYFESVRAEEVEKNINKFSEEDREKLEIITKRIINKILHHPTVELKKLSDENTNSDFSSIKISVIRELFGLAGNKQNQQDKN
ncbi:MULTISPECIES: glutamyl-tRNA reductase [Ignavibacterium]|jgi:glutamyl-tRNA reductase|uniref:glutamyl-tRNA reductase n=1 Tax=Ignavibacterium TaxID=795750 RepID=UPI0025B9A9CF|nr:MULTISPECIES: glutamyl-tRNA reductase [Ignavibacterium]MBI5662478.1 glutamyl-tRNA reductase [Ignavibacterium album]